jgi:hypothetical protein
MDDQAYQRYFTHPTQTYQRQYEALRAVFIDGRSQKEVANDFGFEYGSLRQLLHEFRRCCDAGQAATESPFFELWRQDVPSLPRTNPPRRTSPIDRR